MWPVNENGTHWTFQEVNLNSKECIVHNSLKGSNVNRIQMDHVILYDIAKELFHLIQIENMEWLDSESCINNNNNILQKEWSLSLKLDNAIVQHNNSDCGIFVCCIMEAICQDKYAESKEKGFVNNRQYEMARLYLTHRIVNSNDYYLNC